MDILTEVISQHLLLLEGILCSHRYSGRMGAQSVKPLGPALLSTPLHLALQDVKHGDDIAETAEYDLGQKLYIEGERR